MGFFLGAIFYPKLMKGLFKSAQAKAKIDFIHMTLYKFSSAKIMALAKI
jgi:hypothetical protein